MIEQNLNNITEIQESIEAIDDRIEENSNNIKYLNSSIDLLYAIIGEYDDQIESLQTNVVEVDSKIGEVEEHQKELRNDFEYLKYDFRSFTNEISKWQIDVDERLSGTEDHIQDLNQIISGTTTTLPTTMTTKPPTNDCVYPEDKLKCEHICDTIVYECITDCYHNTQCMRDCWIEHDRCATNCPCNEECPDGCPEPYDGHSCDTWFCQGFIEACAAEYDSDRVNCPHADKYSCTSVGCCWVPFMNDMDQSVPWCHYPKKQNIQP